MSVLNEEVFTSAVEVDNDKLRKYLQQKYVRMKEVVLMMMI